MDPAALGPKPVLDAWRRGMPTFTKNIAAVLDHRCRNLITTALNEVPLRRADGAVVVDSEGVTS